MVAATGELMAGPEAPKRFESGKLLFPTASSLGQMAERRADFIRAERLEPIYLRETAFVKAPPARVWPPDPSETAP